jgi:hypothetical protein
MSYGVALRNSVALGIGGIVPLSGNLEAQPNFNWINNTDLRTALTEAAYTGLVLGMGDPGFEENWLRGVRQGPLATGVTGATYARSGTRAGLDPANLFFDNLIRSSDNLQAGGWFTSSGAVITSATTATLTSTNGSAVEQLVSGTTAGGVTTVSAVLSGSGTVTLINKDGSVGFGTTELTVVLTSTPTRYSVTRTSVHAGTILTVANRSGVAITDLTIQNSQLVQGNVPGPYIPNPSTTLSASQVRREAGRGVRVFGAGTNEARASEAFDDAVWTKTNSTVTANAAVAPDGLTTADKLQETAALGSHNCVQTLTVLSATTYAISIYAKIGERTFVGVYEGVTGVGKWFNLSTGTVGGNIVAAPTSSSIVAFANGWYRCTIVITTVSTTATPSVYLSNDGSTIIYAGTAGSGAFIWGAQLEQSAFATDYIPNASTVASASAGTDVLLVNFTRPTEYTVIAEWTEPPAIASGARAVGIDTGGSPSVLELVSSTSIGSWNGSVLVSGTTPSRAAGSRQLAIFRQTAAGRQIHYNGAQIAADANILTLSSALSVGTRGNDGVNPLNSGISIVAVIPRDIGAAAANAASIL